MEGKNKYNDCITHLRLGRGTQEIQNKAMAISGLQCRGRLVDPAGRPLQSLCAKQLNSFYLGKRGCISRTTVQIYDFL